MGAPFGPYRVWIALSSLLVLCLPEDLQVPQVLTEPDWIIIVAEPRSSTSLCPLCGRASGRVHSHYLRTLADLHWQGQIAMLRLRVLRFRCATLTCPRRIFTEGLPTTTAPRARRTARVGDIQRHVGLALGGQQGARLARRLAMQVGATTLLDMIRRGAPAGPKRGTRVLGVDDWAWRRGGRYGTLLCEIEQHRIIDLLADRRAETLATWLEQHPGVAAISRDRAGAYAASARRGAPDAVQVSDPCHLLKNCGEAVLDAVRRHRAAAQAAALTAAAVEGAPPAGPPPMSSAERRQWDRWQRHRVRYEQVMRLHRDGMPIRTMVRILRISRNRLRRWSHGAALALHRPRQSILEPYRALLERRWAEGCRNGTQLWREACEAGFTGGLRVIIEWATRQRFDIMPARAGSEFAMPSTRRIARILTMDPQELDEPR